MIKIHTVDGNRGVVATRDIRKGTALFRDTALGVVSRTNCQWCLAAATKRCGKCKLYYCSALCQKKDWDRHSKTCGLDDAELEMLIKICNYMDKGKDESVDIFSISKKHHFESLVSHMDKLSAGEIVELRLKAEASGITTHSIEQQVEILSKFRRNNFTIYDFDLFEVGSGTFCLGSMLNHSCVPNAVLIYQKREMIVLALRDIKENEEIFISYIDPINPYDSRCKMLDKYYFKCTCDKCNLKLYPKFNSPSGLEDHVTKGMEILDRYKKVSNNLETCLGFYADFELYRSVSSILLEKLESATNFGLCLGLIVVKVATLIIQYPKSHPLIGLESLVGAKICWNCQQYSLGRKFLEIGNDCHSVYIDYHVNDELVKLNNLYKDL